MAIVSIRELIEAGVHFGHRISRWDPKMKPYIFGKRNLIHIIDLKETVKGLIRTTHFVSNVVARGEDIVFVGTKRQARTAIEAEARRCGMHFVSERWLGGTLTNFRTILSRVQRLDELEKMAEDGSLSNYSKKMISSFQRETRKIKRNLEGIRKMRRVPGALFVVDPRREKNAVLEARKLDIPVVALADTDCDPDMVDIIVPGNDDAMRSVQLVLGRIADAVLEGKSKQVVTSRPEAATMPEAPAATDRRPRGRRDRGPGSRGPGGPGSRGPSGRGRARTQGFAERSRAEGARREAEAPPAQKPSEPQPSAQPAPAPKPPEAPSTEA